MEAQQKYRRTILMFELSVNLLRILEFVVVQVGKGNGCRQQV